jgi:mannose-6-phosphate isomerase-like protein (cupin superfamily)
MPRLVPAATRIPVPGNKRIDEYIGRVNTKDSAVSIAHMQSPSGWSEPGQRPEFDEYTVVLKGSLRVESKDGVLEVKAGQAIIAARGEWVRYSTPGPEGAEYIAVCLAAFDPATVNRDKSGDA